MYYWRKWNCKKFVVDYSVNCSSSLLSRLNWNRTKNGRCSAAVGKLCRIWNYEKWSHSSTSSWVSIIYSLLISYATCLALPFGQIIHQIIQSGEFCSTLVCVGCQFWQNWATFHAEFIKLKENRTSNDCYNLKSHSSTCDTHILRPRELPNRECQRSSSHHSKQWAPAKCSQCQTCASLSHLLGASNSFVEEVRIALFCHWNCSPESDDSWDAYKIHRCNDEFSFSWNFLLISPDTPNKNAAALNRCFRRSSASTSVLISLIIICFA